MDFLTATILSGVVYDQLKKGGVITGNFIKDKLRNWIINDTTSEKIANTINEMPKLYKKSEKILEGAIEADKNLMDILNNIKSEHTYEQNNSNSTNNGNFVNGNGNSTGNIINNYYGTLPQNNLQETNNNKAYDKNLLKLFNESIRDYIKILLDHDFSIQPTNLNYIDKFDEIIKEWSFPDRCFLNLQLEKNKLEIITDLNTLNNYLNSPEYFKDSGIHPFIIPIKDPKRKIFTEMKNSTLNLRKNIIKNYKEINRYY